LKKKTLFSKTSCLSFVADLRDAIHGLHFADRKLLQHCKLLEAQAASKVKALPVEGAV